VVVKKSLERYARGIDYQIIDGSKHSLEEFRERFALKDAKRLVWVKGGVDFDHYQGDIPENGVEVTFSCYGGHHAKDLLAWIGFMLRITRPLEDGQIPISIIDARDTIEHYLQQALPAICEVGAFPNDMTVTHGRALPKEAWELALEQAPGNWLVEEIDPTKNFPGLLQKMPKSWLPRVSQLRVAAHSI